MFTFTFEGKEYTKKNKTAAAVFLVCDIKKSINEAAKAIGIGWPTIYYNVPAVNGGGKEKRAKYMLNRVNKVKEKKAKKLLKSGKFSRSEVARKTRLGKSTITKVYNSIFSVVAGKP